MSKLISVSIFLLTLAGCVSFSPKEEMTLNQVSRAAYAPCEGSQEIKENQLVRIGTHPEQNNIEIYRTRAHQEFKRAKDECAKDLYFYNGKLIGESKLQSLLEESRLIKLESSRLAEIERVRVEEVRLKDNLRRVAMEDFIKEKNLKLHPIFTNQEYPIYFNSSSNSFRVYIDDAQNRYFFNNYYSMAANENLIQNEKSNFEFAVDDNDRKIADRRLEIQLAEEARKKIEIEEAIKTQLAMEARKKIELEEAEEIKNELVISIIIKEKNLSLIYRNGPFAILKDKNNTTLYIKDGYFKENNQVKEDLDAYKNYLLAEREEARRRQEIEVRQQIEAAKQKAFFEALNREFEEKKARNLAYRWIVQAQVVQSRANCDGVEIGCRIISVTHERNDEMTGAAVFVIRAARRWRNSGWADQRYEIQCGFGEQNFLQSGFVRAVCQ